EIQAIFDKWDLNCAQIGVVTEGTRLHFLVNGNLVADVPAHDLVLGGGAPVYHREYSEPAYYKRYQQFNPDTVPQPDYKVVAAYLLKHPNIASRRWITRQFDSMVGASTLTTNAPSDAALVQIRGTDKAISICVDCNGRYVQADPHRGASIAVAEAARNVVCSGAKPLAVTNNLNFGNPYNPEVYWQFVNAVKGMAEGCLTFETPVTGGNVSFYNQSAYDGPVFPTPTIGMLGLLETLDNRMTLNFKAAGDLIYLLGAPQNDIACSEYLYSFVGTKESPAPYYNAEEELILHKALTRLIEEGLLRSAHDLSDGGLYISLAESALPGLLGFSVKTDPAFRKDAYLFGEAQGRAIVSILPDAQMNFEEEAARLNVPYTLLGTVTAHGFEVDGELFAQSVEAREAFDTGLEKALG
ncbi:MAG: AIR synthase related protein, partial [Bacteroidota bacterium]